MKEKELLSALKKCPLFFGIEEKEFPELFSFLDSPVKSFARGSIFLPAGSPALSTGIVISGHAQIIYEDIFGNRSILGTLLPGDLFAEAFSMVGVSILPVSAYASTDCSILLIDSKRLLSPCPFQEKLAKNMLQILAEKNVVLNQKIRYLSRRSTREKLLAYLSDQAKTQRSRHFFIPFQRQELADFLCVERSAMSAELGKLKKEGILDFRRSEFWLFPDSALCSSFQG